MDRRSTIIEKNPIRGYLERMGHTFVKKGPEDYTKCPIHQDGKNGNFRIKDKDQLWYCDVCGFGGSVIDLVMRLKGFTSPFPAMDELDGGNSWEEIGKIRNGQAKKFKPEEEKPAPDGNTKIAATYDYTDENGTLRYQAVRLDPKDFRQRKPDGKGGWEWTLKGVSRVLYNLPKVLKSTTPVWIVEGEKDADNLAALGFTTTTNVCGSEKWMDAYSFSLKGKQCVVCPDNDEKGEAHRIKVMESIADHARSVRYVKVPEPHKDISDFIEAVGKEKALEKIIELFDASVELIGGIELPVYSMDEAEAHYIDHIQESKRGGILDLGEWLPGLKKLIRPLSPGDFAVFLGSTGVGKTAFLQNLSLRSGLETLFIEMEVTRPTIFERFAQMSTGQTGEAIELAYAAGARVEWRADERMKHIHICDKAGLTTEQIEKIIVRSELKIGTKCKLVVVDYLQLIRGKGQSRYERFSDIAENLKGIAKSTGTIVVAASQISRKEDGDKSEVFLHDAKESGSIENSAGLVLGAWKKDDKPDELIVKVLKCTRGKPGARVTCVFDGARMTMVEKIKTQDVPA